MLFNSLEFLLFFPIVCLIYFLISSNKWRNIFLLVASYYFYMCWEPVYALLLLTSTGITYTASILMDRHQSHAKKILTASIISNLSILFFFKYYNFAAENITDLMSLFGVKLYVPEFRVLLPVGISFYIFQALGYAIDVYRGDVKVERNFLTYALFVSFFPQLVAGPIERSTNLLQQFHKKVSFDGRRAIEGLNLMCWGFFLKLVLADRCAIFVDTVFDNIDYQNGGNSILGAILFCFQLYGDFAGYSYIAIGCAKVMGFRLMDNFRRPYFFSVSIQDFWKRNHISLTTWFMDYLYYPMVGSSSNIYWWCFCIFFTFFVSGFWHGAAWNYVASFTLWGLCLVGCILKDKSQKKFEKKHNLKKKEWWIWLNRILTFYLVSHINIFFRASSVTDGVTCLENIYTKMQFPVLGAAKEQIFYCVIALIIVFIAEYAIEYKKVKISDSNCVAAYSCMSALLISCILFLGILNGGQFIYFQF